MSLTRHLDDPGSPVRRFFDATYPHLPRVKFASDSSPVSVAMAPVVVDGREVEVSVLNRFQPGPAVVLPRLQRDGESGYDWGTAGAAFDYRLRCALSKQDAAELVAAAGARRLAKQLSLPAPGLAWHQLVEAVAELPTGFEHPSPGASSVDRLCVLLALYEQWYRAPAEHLANHQLLLAGPDAELTDHLALIDDRLVDDVARLTALFGETQHELAVAVDVAANPTFDRSADLGGADADLVVDDMLIELKTTKNAALTKVTVWQLLGYVLADTSDRYKIRRVGWYFSRQGYLWSMPVTELLERLRGTEVDLVTARAEFADLLTQSLPRADHDRPTAEATPPLAKVERTVSFYPLASGRGRWHIARAQIFGTWDWGDPAGPICGARAVLDFAADPARPEPGQAWASDDRLCRTCLAFTRRGWGDLVLAGGHLPSLRPDDG